jgi:zinc transporter ZupT
MSLNIIILFVVAIAGGSLAYLIPEGKENNSGFKLSLVFAGSYLFSITILHLIPNLYLQNENTLQVGVFILIGFFFQQILEYFTSGIEHGHLHQKSSSHHHHSAAAFSAVIALSIHAFLEGTLISNPLNSDERTTSIMIGIILHKVPAAFALMSVILCHTSSKSKALPMLLIFAIASPLGVILAQLGVSNQWVSSSLFGILFAIVCGSFLHISTTIVFESSPQHAFNYKKLLAGILGASTAILFELFT